MLNLFFKEKIIYRSGRNKWRFLTGKLACLYIIISGLLHFNENPVVITIVVGLILMMVLFFYDEEIILFETKFIYILGFQNPFKKTKEYHYFDIKKIFHPVEYEVKNIPKNILYRNKGESEKKIHIIFKDDSELLFNIPANNYSICTITEKLKENIF
jgi:hypothetical protein